MIEINIEVREDASVVRLSGEIDATNAGDVLQKITPLLTPGGYLILEMSGVKYMSSAGLRMLLSIYRHASTQSGKILIVGLSDDLKDTMSMTGFLGYFTLADQLP